MRLEGVLDPAGPGIPEMDLPRSVLAAPVATRGSDPSVVGAEGHTPDVLLGAGQGCPEFSPGNLPDPDLAIAARRCQQVASLIEGQTRDSAGSLRHRQDLALLRHRHVPQLDLTVIAAGGQSPPIGMEGQGEDPTPMADEDRPRLSGGRIPQDRRAVIAARGDHPSVGAEADLVDAVAVTDELLAQAAVLRVIEPDDRIVAPRRDRPSVGAERREHRRSPMITQAESLLPRPDVPDDDAVQLLRGLERGGSAHGGDHTAAVGAERRRIRGLLGGRDLADRRARCRVQDPYASISSGAIAAGDDQASAVGAECTAGMGPRPDVDRHPGLAAIQLPDQDRVRLGRGPADRREPAAIEAQRQARTRAAIPAPHVTQTPRLDIPDPDSPIVAGGGEIPTVARETETIHGPLVAGECEQLGMAPPLEVMPFPVPVVGRALVEQSFGLIGIVVAQLALGEIHAICVQEPSFALEGSLRDPALSIRLDLGRLQPRLESQSDDQGT